MTTFRGKTALHFASESDQLDMVQYLVEEGKVNVDAVDNTLSTALHKAVRHRLFAMITLSLYSS